MHDKPMVLLDPVGHYTGLLAWLESMVDTGFVARRALDALQVTGDIEDALDRCGVDVQA